jgi:phosphate transport system permease protein
MDPPEAPPAPAAPPPESGDAGEPGADGLSTGDGDLTQNLLYSPTERAVEYALGACALLSVLTTLGIAAVLVIESIPFFAEVSLASFFGEMRWTPEYASQHFGIWPLLSGTFLITGIAAVLALPLGLMSAIYISEYAPRSIRVWLKPTLEVLAGVPTVVYGYFALTFVTPLLDTFVPGLNTYNALSAGLVVGVMIIPMVASLSEDALQAVPRSIREGGYALGATKIEVTGRVVVPGALGGIVAGFILAISRAIGETMIVTIAAGQQANLTADPTQSVRTMTAYIAQIASGDVAQGTVVYDSIFAVGLVLFLITLALNLFANDFVRRFQERY